MSVSQTSTIIHNHLLSNNSVQSTNSINYEWRGDFLGFTIGGIHSSTLGIVRISDGDRYSEELVPTYSDITATVRGRDETYYFGTDFTQKVFTIKFGFEDLTDVQLRKLRQIFSKKEPQDLIFDEVPYKVYSVKCNGQPQLSYVCFDGKSGRIYKGDGTVNFIAYYPFARSRYKYLNEYTLANIPEWKGSDSDNEGILNNKEEWASSSGMITTDKKTRDNEFIDLLYTDGNQNYINLHNPSDIEVSPKILIYFPNEVQSDNLILSLLGSSDASNDKELIIDIQKIKEDNSSIYGIVIDSFTKLIYPLNSPIGISEFGNPRAINNSKIWDYDKTKVYNNYIVSGDFFDFPICFYNDTNYYCIFNDVNCKMAIDYDYLYY